ncbi:sugar ABC transporter permease [Niallia circulans]|jgi:sn-glycerol 3-phosphate transport system permease protein|uniref:Glycerol-3-phosphate ABC transporter permease n=1 Tax=Niallia circulans TaxID=1397 RepID=A0A0J1IM75_NIACI|nr:sugar ABC transporter permease [Niallia circulans]KLV26988.1 glycerol-3-phosphate ABC transporter permease [Niallia circulans]MCM2979446.1 sugar ABC transporter permease [Niallia circulans]MED5100513.1 sugar ABC transporter permease [Niallia circulans]PAD26795.1 sugar ABC transporter permease [Niallia circulans]PAD88626.1 sugar ABC transporter permease [Niallia circulans]
MSEVVYRQEVEPSIDFIKEKKKQRLQYWLKGMLFLLPSILLFSVFLFYPLGRTIFLSFFLTDNRGDPTVFVGLENYLEIFKSAIFLQSLKSTFLFALYTVPGSIIVSLFLAILANEKLRGIGVFRTVFSSSMGISVAAASVFWMFLFHPTIGWLNRIVKTFGLEPIGWLTDPNWALFSVSISTIWMNVGFTFLILLGGLQSIDSYLYESADIDGAGYFYKLRRITIPMLSPTLFFVLTVTLINAFQTFGQVDMLTRGGPQNETNLIVYSIYQEAFMNYQYGTASAQAIILFVIILVLTIIQFKLGERKVHYQ